ncbi:glycosyltransferase family A protein, partial [Burkholderia gladioli]|uniref:glycosyltransferase family 2 protein n=1 Tax=Burkholderia gladioli TaxID=28095 RepID=UPI0030EF792C
MAAGAGRGGHRQCHRDPRARPVRRPGRPGRRLPGRRLGQFHLYPPEAAHMSSSLAPAGALDEVAVLIPAYNGHDDLERSLASLAETAPVHVLVVDDGSTPP